MSQLDYNKRNYYSTMSVFNDEVFSCYAVTNHAMLISIGLYFKVFIILVQLFVLPFKFKI